MEDWWGYGWWLSVHRKEEDQKFHRYRMRARYYMTPFINREHYYYKQHWQPQPYLDFYPGDKELQDERR